MAERIWSDLVRRRWLVVALVALALVGLALIAFNASRLLRHRPPPPRQTDVSLIAGWMTVRYVGRTFGTPPPELYRALGVAPETDEQSSLNELATQTGRSADEVVEIVRQTVREFQANHRGPPGEQSLPGPNGGPPGEAATPTPPAGPSSETPS